MNSVHTNLGQVVALQSFSRVSKLLDRAQKRISTGYRVNDANDDGAAFAVAQGLRANIKSYGAVSERLAATKGLLTVSLDALSKVSNAVINIRNIGTKLADAGLSTTERTQYAKDVNDVKNDMTRLLLDADFGGQNLLDNAATINVIFDNKGGTFALKGQNITTQATTILGSIPVTPAGYLAAIASGGSLSQFESVVNTSLVTLSSYLRSVDDQMDFLDTLQDAATDSIGSIVDADLSQESATLQALQIRQQLNLQTLSIANQAPSFLLNLFSNAVRVTA